MLYLVATPIGNLGDITMRALETLRTVDVIASEDTRKTLILLKHYDIHKPMLACHEHNEKQVTERLIGMMREGKSVALVSDAGTPAISDPGFVLVRRVLAEGLPLTAIPGPVAMIPALIVSGLAVHAFTYRGFPPRKSGARQRWLAQDLHTPHTLIFYESPYRIVALVDDALTVYGDRNAALANDLTKFHETVWRGPLSQIKTVLASKAIKGEFVLLIAGSDGSDVMPDFGDEPDDRIDDNDTAD
ncbi:MAG: 16S rRNA (cytidine(1402)-2'-O)-methyltransferase [Roseiflexaceae bacterium]